MRYLRSFTLNKNYNTTMAIQRVDRLNSLLKEVISHIIKREVKNPNVSELTTVTRVEITKDLKHAKVYVSVIGDEKQRTETLAALNSAAGFIAVKSSKEVVMRFFPTLLFKIDTTVEQHIRIQELLYGIQEERESREPHEENESSEENE